MTVQVVMGGADYERLQSHLHQADRDEHGAIALAGIHVHGGKTRLLVRELHLLSDEQFPSGEHGYRQFAPLVTADLAGEAGDRGLAYVTFHSHPGSSTSTALSSDDLAGHRRVFPHLLDLTGGNPVVGIATGTHTVAGEIWQAGQAPAVVDDLRVIGTHLHSISGGRGPLTFGHTEVRYERQARMFGEAGQAILRGMHVAVIGAGGGGSMIAEQLVHLGVGEITVIDFDRVEEHNLSRIVGATRDDAARRTSKVEVAKRTAQRINADVRVNAILGDIADEAVAQQLLGCDFLFLATDTVTSRLVFNAMIHRFLIPGIQIGAKVELGTEQRVEEVYVAVRPVYPESGCLYCQGLIDPIRLQREARSEDEVRAQNYVGGGPERVIDPSVISLNGIAASHAVNTMLFSATGLLGLEPAQQLFFPRDGSALSVTPNRQSDCPFCSQHKGSVYAAGGTAGDLPVRPVTTVRPQDQLHGLRGLWHRIRGQR